MNSILRITLIVAFAFCLSEYLLNEFANRHCDIDDLLFVPETEWLLFVCMVVWCASLIVLTYRSIDLCLVGFCVIVLFKYICGYITAYAPATALVVLTSVALARGIRLLTNDRSAVFILYFIYLLTMASWVHIEATENFYRGKRWMGLWNNPNDYGMLMGAGVVLAMGLIAASRKSAVHNPKSQVEPPTFTVHSPQSSIKGEGGVQKDEINNRTAESGKAKTIWKSAIGNWKLAILLVAVFMMGVGLVMSYSRGAWLGAAIGSLYLAKAYGKFSWRYVMLGTGLVALGVLYLWGRTPDSAPWYFQRLDLSRGSVQHRLAAWRGGLQMMRDHPFGVGWNQAIEIYKINYSPPANGSVAISTNNFLMLGDELGISALVCFVSYVALCFRSPKSKVQGPKPAECGVRSAGCGIETEQTQARDEFQIKTACRAGALAMLVAFWFDGGLFKLATASVFWILLELGSERQKLTTEILKAETDQSKVETFRRRGQAIDRCI